MPCRETDWPSSSQASGTCECPNTGAWVPLPLTLRSGGIHLSEAAPRFHQTSCEQKRQGRLFPPDFQTQLGMVLPISVSLCACLFLSLSLPLKKRHFPSSYTQEVLYSEIYKTLLMKKCYVCLPAQTSFKEMWKMFCSSDGGAYEDQLYLALCTSNTLDW